MPAEHTWPGAFVCEDASHLPDTCSAHADVAQAAAAAFDKGACHLLTTRYAMMGHGVRPPPPAGYEIHCGLVEPDRRHGHNRYTTMSLYEKPKKNPLEATRKNALAPWLHVPRVLLSYYVPPRCLCRDFRV